MFAKRFKEKIDFWLRVEKQGLTHKKEVCPETLVSTVVSVTAEDGEKVSEVSVEEEPLYQAFAARLEREYGLVKV